MEMISYRLLAKRTMIPVNCQNGYCQELISILRISRRKCPERKEEGLGWASEGWNAQKASVELTVLKKAHTLGTGPHSLQEKREAEG